MRRNELLGHRVWGAACSVATGGMEALSGLRVTDVRLLYSVNVSPCSSCSRRPGTPCRHPDAPGARGPRLGSCAARWEASSASTSPRLSPPTGTDHRPITEVGGTTSLQQVEAAAQVGPPSPAKNMRRRGAAGDRGRAGVTQDVRLDQAACGHVSTRHLARGSGDACGVHTGQGQAERPRRRRGRRAVPRAGSGRLLPRAPRAAATFP